MPCTLLPFRLTHMRVLSDSEQFTLSQLSDTALLGSHRLDDAICARLRRMGLVSADGHGWWRLTPTGLAILGALAQYALEAEPPERTR